MELWELETLAKSIPFVGMAPSLAQLQERQLRYVRRELYFAVRVAIKHVKRGEFGAAFFAILRAFCMEAILRVNKEAIQKRTEAHIKALNGMCNQKKANIGAYYLKAPRIMAVWALINDDIKEDIGDTYSALNVPACIKDGISGN